MRAELKGLDTANGDGGIGECSVHRGLRGGGGCVTDSPATFTKLTRPTPLQARALELADTITIP